MKQIHFWLKIKTKPQITVIFIFWINSIYSILTIKFNSINWISLDLCYSFKYPRIIRYFPRKLFYSNEKKTFYNELFKRAIKCHHNEIAQYIFENYYNDENGMIDLYDFIFVIIILIFFPDGIKNCIMFLWWCQISL